MQRFILFSTTNALPSSSQEQWMYHIPFPRDSSGQQENSRNSLQQQVWELPVEVFCMLKVTKPNRITLQLWQGGRRSCFPAQPIPETSAAEAVEEKEEEQEEVVVCVAKRTSFYEIAGARRFCFVTCIRTASPCQCVLRCMSLFCVVGFVAGASFSADFRRDFLCLEKRCCCFIACL